MDMWENLLQLSESQRQNLIEQILFKELSESQLENLIERILFKKLSESQQVNLIEQIIFKLSESQLENLIERILFKLHLKNGGINIASKDSAGKSGTDSKECVNLSNSTPEKSFKQKSLDNWIMKSKTPSSNCQKELAKEAEESSRNVESEKDEEGKKLEKSSKLDDAINKKKLMVLLNRQDCLESSQKSPDHSKLSTEKKLSSPINVKSPNKKNKHVSENSDQRNISPEKYSPMPTRSYNLRARRVIDEKPCDETNNFVAISAECENSDKIRKPIHKSVTKQKQKFKTSLGNSSFVEMDYDQKTNSCNDKTSEDNINNSECKISPPMVQSELERTLVDSNKIIVTDENSIVVELSPSLVIKGKRKRSYKDKESKKVCTSSAVQKSSDNQESGVTQLNESNKSSDYVPSKKVTKLSIINADSSELTIEKTAQLPGTVVSTSPTQEQVTNNNIVKSDSKLKLKKTIKSKVKSDMILHGEIKLDSTASKIKTKNLPSQEINSDITINTDFQKISDEQLESTKNSESQIKECVKETEKLLTKDIKSFTAINGDSKRISKKRGHENKRMMTTQNSSLSVPDQESTSKNNNIDFTTSINSLSKISSSQNKEFAKETDELSIKETHILTPVNAKKKGKVSAKNSLISDSEQSSKNNDEISIASFETSAVDSLKNLASQSKKLSMGTEESLINGTDTLFQLDVNSKKIYRKKSNDNKSKRSIKNNLISESEQSPKSNNMDSFTLETSSIDFSKNLLSQSKEFVKDTEESLIKDTFSVTTLNIKSKKICRKKNFQNKVQLSAKKSLIVDSEEASKIIEMDNITPEISSFDSSKNSSSQNKDLAKVTEELLIRDTSTETQIAANSERMYRKKSSENKSRVVAKTNLISNSEPASKNSDKDNTISTPTDSSNNSPSRNKKFAKETEDLLIKDTTIVTPLSVKSKRIRGKKTNENKSVAATKNILKSDSEQTSKNNGKNNINSIETSLIDLPKTSITKDISTKEISSDTEETISLNWNNCSKPINAFTRSDDHSRKNSKFLNSNSHNELSILNEMEETEDNLSKKSNAVPLNVPQTNDNILESSQVSGVSKKVSSLKKKNVMQLPTNSKKKLKVTKNEIQSNVTQSSSHSLNIENENLHLKKSGTKKIVASTKIKLGSDSNKEQSDVPIAKSMANSSHSNAVQEPKDHLHKNSKENNKLGQARKETIRFKNSKKVKQNNSKKKNNLVPQIVCSSNISKNDEMEKLNCNLVGERSTKNKHHKGTSLSMIKTDNSECKKENHDIIKSMEGKTEKATDFIVNNSNNTDSAEINFKDLVEFDEKMKHNYEAFCKVKDVLRVIGISIEEIFENPDMINSLKSVSPDGVYFISKCKSNSKLSVHMHESKKELRNILNEMKRMAIAEGK
ncbi:hypothetical protein HNY73_015763 [Argiope bruennichi]|uniref:Uncharacterized protein n=1 Tax=Argiope bruennichi TaxID=94029 RepID=A0A8T0ELI1_ARGBR|nr:hypothetical protein HNY73_015763 [Argiope bruennichi]